jgi:L-ascorbate metabolism protein UlaG (beta-lactamase superfamily)
MEPTICRYGQSSLRIEAEGLTVYIDPYQVPDGEPPADVLMLTHDHGDHLSLDDIARVRHEDTVVFASPPAAAKVDFACQVLNPGDTAEHGPLKIRAVPAYTTTKFRPSGEATHPKEALHVGFVFEIGDVSFYFSGDTDVIPEMDAIGPVDYAFLPVSGKFVMTADEAADACRRIQPSVAVPVHYGAVVGSVDDAERFSELVPDQVRVWILEPKES